jgi:hypothetical protein
MAAKKDSKVKLPEFIVQEVTWAEMGARLGRAGLRFGTYVGISALANMDSLKVKPVRKYMPWIAVALGLAGELGLSDKSNSGRVMSGVAQGLFTWGMVDGVSGLMGDETKAKLGLSGMGAPRTDDIPRDESGIDWFRMADEAEEEAANRPGASRPMAGLTDNQKKDPIAFG